MTTEEIECFDLLFFGERNYDFYYEGEKVERLIYSADLFCYQMCLKVNVGTITIFLSRPKNPFPHYDIVYESVEIEDFSISFSKTIQIVFSRGFRL